MTEAILLLLLVLLISTLPVYPYSRGWGYYPSGIIAAIVVVLVMMQFV